MKIDGENFWNRFDAILSERGINLRVFSLVSGVPYDTMVTQRTRRSVPKLGQLIDMAKALDSTMEYMIMGTAVEDPLFTLLRENRKLKTIATRLTYCDQSQLATINMIIDSWGVAPSVLATIDPDKGT